MRILSIAVCAGSLLAWSAGAQQVLRKDPAVYAGPNRASRVEVRPPGIRLGLRKPREVALAPLSEVEVATLTGPGTRLRAGVLRKVAPHALSAGSWETTPAGGRVWRMAVRSPGAHGMRVEFTNFDAAAGRVWLHDGTTIAGPYSGKGPHEDGHFWSESVFSESAILEYEPAAGVSGELEPPFEMRTIAHQQIVGMDLTAGTKDPADYCELDANCYPEWKGTVSMVGQITFVESGVSYLCSGSLVGTRDNSFKPYFLTAGHCIHSEEAARTVEAYWTYQTPACGGTAPADRSASAKSTGGAHLIASGSIEEGDYSLILLQNIPAGVTFAGWDTGDPGVSADLIGIHHPSGSWKRISFGNRAGDANVEVEGSAAPGGKYFQVLLDRGRIEHGSSGSPLFSAPGVIVGSLSYGEVLGDGTVCRISPQGAGYSRFSNTYAHVKDYLENLPATIVSPDRPKLNFTVTNRTASAGQPVRLTTQTSGQIPYQLRSDASWILISNSNGSAPGSVTVTVDAAQLTQAGPYQGTVTILSGAAPPQFINITATVQMDQSNVTPSITPAPVVQSGGRWGFQIRLLETAGVATHLTAIKFNGADYSSSMANWFGTAKLGANGAIVAPLTGAGVFPSGDQYFEFWGADDVTGSPWYRVATVTFR
jgi:hypothetical protein